MTAVEQQQQASAVGAPLLRKEDPELLTGQARFIDDLAVPGMVWMALARSPYAHARITSVDLSQALAAEGVLAAYSATDLAEETAPLPCAWTVTPDMKAPEHRPLAGDKARYAGDAVAVVVAATRALAKDAAELVQVDFEPLPAVTEVEAALADGAPLVHDDFGTNESYTWTLAAGPVEESFANAAVTVEERYYQQRLIPNAMETRGVLVQPVPAQGEYTIWSSTQVPHILRALTALTLGIPEAKVRVIAPDVGGGFGSKLNVYAEEQLAVALARKLGRPIKWIEDRSEAYTATIHGRDVVQEIELAATAEGKITAVRVRLIAAMGAYLQLVTPGIPLLGAWLYAGCYDVQGYDFTCTGVFTNTTPTDAYRGAGRPEATYAIEHAVDALARKLGKDPAELRRINFIREFPATLASGLTMDAGDFDAGLDRLLEVAGYDDLRREQAERRERNDTKQLGIGIATYTEMCGLAPSRVLAAINFGAGGWEAATIRCLPTGTVQVLTGTSPHGQGHATTWSQIVADRLGFAPEEIEVLHGDTAVMPLGLDTYGSRSLAVGGVAVYHAADKVIDKARTIAAHTLEAAEDDLEYADGRFSVAGSPERGFTVKEAAFAAWTAHNLPDGMEPGLEGHFVYDPPNFSWPSGAHLAVVEIDTETGAVELVRYIAVDDVGRVINPLIVAGQVHGGVTQGIAAALWEEAVYDEDGTLLTGTMVNYLVPTAAELPSFELDGIETLSPTNPLGVKGVGETGTIAAPVTVMNAVVDALQPYGVRDVQMPATPERVWRAIEEAR